MSTAIAWKIPDEADPTGGRFVARDSEFEGPLHALDLYATARVMGFDNCLKRGDGPLIRMAVAADSTPLRIHLRQTTLRDAGSLMQWKADASAQQIQPALIICENSVFAMRGEQPRLLEFTAAPPAGWQRMLQITGEGSLLRSGTSLAFAGASPLDGSQLRVEGLILDDFEFAGDHTASSASVVVSSRAPRSSSQAPGIDASRLPTPQSPAVARRRAEDYNSLVQ